MSDTQQAVGTQQPDFVTSAQAGIATGATQMREGAAVTAPDPDVTQMVLVAFVPQQVGAAHFLHAAGHSAGAG